METGKWISTKTLPIEDQESEDNIDVIVYYQGRPYAAYLHLGMFELYESSKYINPEAVECYMIIPKRPKYPIITSFI